MMKIIASLVIFGLCANVCFGLGAAPVSSSNSAAFTSSLLNSTATKVWIGSNTTDAANWDSSSTTTTAAGVLAAYTYFGPGTSNGTSYVYGVSSSGYTSATSTGTASTGSTVTVYTTTSIRKRTLNATLVGYGNDTSVENSVISDTAISTSILGALGYAAVAPGYLAILTTSYDSATATTINAQVYITLITGSTGSAATTKLTSTSDLFASSSSVPTVGAVCVITTFSLGNIWYDIGAGAFFFTYSKTVKTSAAAMTAGTCGTATTAVTVNLGGIYLNGTLFWTTPISAAAYTSTNAVSSLMGGSDNWLNSSNIYIIYKDTTSTVLTTYYSKTVKSTATTAVATFASLIKDTTSGTISTSTYVIMTYLPSTVWASNFTYGMTVSNTTGTGATPTYTYMYTNFLNGSTTGVDSGLSNSAATAVGYYTGWPLNTGYAVLATWQTSTTAPIPTSYTFGSYLANGTVNQTAAVYGSTTYVGAQFYEDANGAYWIGWQDVDTANTITPGGYLSYTGYLAKFQGQINVPGSSAAKVLSVFSAVFLLFAVIFIF